MHQVGRSAPSKTGRSVPSKSRLTGMRLHWYWSTNPQKIRLALEELGLPYELNEVNLAEGAHKEPEYLAIHPRGKVPALEVDGTVLWESGAALLYLGERERRLWPGQGSAHATALNLLFMESAAWQDRAGIYFYNRVVLPFVGTEPDEERIQKAAKKIRPLLELLSSQLEGSDFLLGDFTLLDCAYAPWLPALDLEEFPRLVLWRERLVNRPSWAACAFTY